MELLLWLQTIAFFAQVFDMESLIGGFNLNAGDLMLNLSDLNAIFYIKTQTLNIQLKSKRSERS